MPEDIKIGAPVFILPIREYGTIAKIRVVEGKIIVMVRRISDGHLHNCRTFELQYLS